MRVTAEEAKTKWCPFARVRDGMRQGAHHIAVNRFHDTTAAEWPNCIADGCMMWEWRTNPGPENTKGKQRRGVCGLAKAADG